MESLYVCRYINQITKKSPPYQECNRGLIYSYLEDSKNKIINHGNFYIKYYRHSSSFVSIFRRIIFLGNKTKIPLKKNIFPKKKRKRINTWILPRRERENPLLAASWDGSAERRAQGQDRCASLPAATGGGVWGAATLVARPRVPQFCRI